MRTVEDFFDKVLYNENHNIRVKSQETDDVLAYFDDSRGLSKSGYAEYEIKHFATDWENKIYILWV